MKKIRIFAALLAAILLLPAPARAEGALSFGEDGTFTILVLSDVEEQPEVSPYYGSALSRLLEEHQPDLAVLLGDQIQGDGRAYRGIDRTERARTTISAILAPLEEHRVPFVPVLGGADLASGLTGAELLALYGEGGLNLRRDTGEAFRLAINPWSGETACLELFFFDETGPAGAAAHSGTGAEQVDWFKQQTGAEDTLTDTVPAVSFAHTILPEIYEALTPAAAAGKNTVTGPDGVVYEKDSGSILLGVLNEAPTVPRENSGLLAAFSEAGNVFLSVSGNNHTNAFLTAAEGIDLLACPSASYTARSDRSLRGAWLIRFSEDNVEDYELRFVPFADYENLENGGWLVYALSTYFILSRNVKAGILIGLLALCVAAAFLLMGRKGKTGEQAPSEEENAEEND